MEKNKGMTLSAENATDSRTCKKTRDTILHTAYRLFSKNGFFSTTMVDLASEAELTRRTLYNYYDTKEKLCRDLHPLVLEYVQEILHAIPDTGNTAQENMEHFFLELHQVLLEDTELLNYLVKFDYFCNTYPRQFKKSTCLGETLEKHLEERIINSGESLNSIISSMERQVIVEGFLAYLERLTFRLKSYHAAEKDSLFELNFFINALVSGRDDGGEA